MRHSPSGAAIFMHTLLVFLTGGAWLIVLLVMYLLKR